MASLIKRGKTYYAQVWLGTHAKRWSLKTKSIQIAREKLRQIESAQLKQEDLPVPTRTSIAEAVSDYVEYMRAHKTPRSVRADVSYLRDSFGPVCPVLENSSNPKRKIRNQIQVGYLEDVSTESVSRLISTQVHDRDLAPKTANRYREVLHSLFNWAMNEHGVHMPGSKNPVSRVRRYKERPRDIRFLTLKQIDEQLDALKDEPYLQIVVATFIYTGLRREELTWLTHADIDSTAGRYGAIKVRAKTDGKMEWQPKTNTHRVIPISSSLYNYLRDYQPRIVPGHWYFPSPKGMRWDADNLGRYFRKANKRVERPWNFLDYRHTFGSQLAMKGESLYKIATLMGNSPEICRKHYATLLPESLENSVEFHDNERCRQVPLQCG